MLVPTLFIIFPQVVTLSFPAKYYVLQNQNYLLNPFLSLLKHHRANLVFLLEKYHQVVLTNVHLLAIIRGRFHVPLFPNHMNLRRTLLLPSNCHRIFSVDYAPTFTTIFFNLLVSCIFYLLVVFPFLLPLCFPIGKLHEPDC